MRRIATSVIQPARHPSRELGVDQELHGVTGWSRLV
jgi:hypothetical protein